MAASLYELLPVAAIVIVVGGIFVGAAQLWGHAGERLGHTARSALFVACYLALAVYFVWCWRAGQTLPMKAWRLRVLAVGDSAPTPAQRPSALRPYVTRFVLASIAWGLASGALLWLREHSDSAVAWVTLLPLVAALAWRFLDSDRQALYDRLAGTRLVVEPRSASD